MSNTSENIKKDEAILEDIEKADSETSRPLHNVDEKKYKIFEREGCFFTVPNRPNVRQQLEYFSATVGRPGNQMFIRLWMGARELITNWECENLPDIKTDLEEMTDPSQTELIAWVALKVKGHMDALEDMSPNS